MRPAVCEPARRARFQRLQRLGVAAGVQEVEADQILHHRSARQALRHRPLQQRQSGLGKHVVGQHLAHFGQRARRRIEPQQGLGAGQRLAHAAGAQQQLCNQFEQLRIGPGPAERAQRVRLARLRIARTQRRNRQPQVRPGRVFAHAKQAAVDGVGARILACGTEAFGLLPACVGVCLHRAGILWVRDDDSSPDDLPGHPKNCLEHVFDIAQRWPDGLPPRTAATKKDGRAWRPSKGLRHGWIRSRTAP